MFALSLLIIKLFWMCSGCAFLIVHPAQHCKQKTQRRSLGSLSREKTCIPSIFSRRNTERLTPLYGADIAIKKN